MKGIFKIISIGILLAALAGGLILVRKNQETRRGAAANETSAQILPSQINTEVNKTFTVDVWLNTGKVTDTLVGAEFIVGFDPKLTYVSSTALNGYTILQEDSEGGADRSFKIVAMGEEKGGAFNVVKMTFKATAGGSTNVIVGKGAKLMINGQAGMWDLGSGSASVVKIQGGAVTPILTCTPRPPCMDGVPGPNGEKIFCDPKPGVVYCPKPTPSGVVYCDRTGCPEGYRCKVPNISPKPCPTGRQCPVYDMPRPVCEKISTPTPSVTGVIYCDLTGVCPAGYQCVKPEPCPVGKFCAAVMGKPYCKKIIGTTTPAIRACGQRCTSSNQCGSGMTCAPIWWPCAGIPAGISAKLETDASLDKATVSQMIQACPEAKRTLPSGYESQTSVKMPAFYGVCRNVRCVKSADCKCTGAITPTPSIISGEQANFELAFTTGTNAKLGDVVQVNLAAVANTNSKISATRVRIQYDPKSLEYVKLDSEGRETKVKEEVDQSAGLITIYYTWNLSSDRLFNRYTVANIFFKTKTAGATSLIFDKSYENEISGINSQGLSAGFKLNYVNVNSLYITGTTNACVECSSGLARSSGNANCDDQVNSVDFEIWRGEMFDQGGLSGTVNSAWKSDFNCDQKVSGTDFEIWRSTVFK